MKVFWKDQDLGEFDEPTFKEIRAIKKMTGVFPGSPGWESALREGNPDPIIAMIVVMLARSGQQVRFDDIDGRPSDIRVEYSEAEQQQRLAEDVEKTIAPATRRILERLGVPLDDEAHIYDVVLEEMQAAAEQEQGKDQPTAELSTPTT